MSFHQQTLSHPVVIHLITNQPPNPHPLPFYPSPPPNKKILILFFVAPSPPWIGVFFCVDICSANHVLISHLSFSPPTPHFCLPFVQPPPHYHCKSGTERKKAGVGREKWDIAYHQPDERSLYGNLLLKKRWRNRKGMNHSSLAIRFTTYCISEFQINSTWFVHNFCPSFITTTTVFSYLKVRFDTNSKRGLNLKKILSYHPFPNNKTRLLLYTGHFVKVDEEKNSNDNARFVSATKPEGMATKSSRTDICDILGITLAVN